MKTTEYFRHVRKRPDRATIRDEWIHHVMEHAEKTEVQSDGRVRKWARISETGRFCGSFCSTTVKPFTTRSSTDRSGRAAMRVKYFPDTDTALMEFTDNAITETK